MRGQISCMNLVASLLLTVFMCGCKPSDMFLKESGEEGPSQPEERITYTLAISHKPEGLMVALKDGEKDLSSRIKKMEFSTVAAGAPKVENPSSGWTISYSAERAFNIQLELENPELYCEPVVIEGTKGKREFPKLNETWAKAIKCGPKPIAKDPKQGTPETPGPQIFRLNIRFSGAGSEYTDDRRVLVFPDKKAIEMPDGLTSYPANGQAVHSFLHPNAGKFQVWRPATASELGKNDTLVEWKEDGTCKLKGDGLTQVTEADLESDPVYQVISQVDSIIDPEKTSLENLCIKEGN